MALFSAKIVSLLLSVVAGIFLISWLFYPSSGLGQTTTAVIDTVDEYADIGVDVVDASIVSTAASDQEAFDQFIGLLEEIREKTKEEGQTNCFAKFSGFPVFQSAGSSISFESRDYASSGSGYDFSSKIRLYGGEGGQQIVSSEVVDGIKPCLIADYPAYSHFKDIFIDAEVTFENKEIKLPEEESYYTDVFSFTVYGDGEQNHLIYGEKFDFEDAWIFTPDGNSMCFFPTVSNLGNSDCNFRKGVLNHNCFDEEVSSGNSLPKVIEKNGVARYCKRVSS